MNLVTIHCGRSGYRELWNIQKTIWKARIAGKVPDTLLLTEHDHVYTLGRTADANHLIASGGFLREKGIDVVETDRGGDVTYHGPGQLVVYPIVSLERFGNDLHRYVRMLEESILRMLEDFGIRGNQDPAYTGVWVGDEKLASIGIRVGRWVTMHGAAINVSTDLSYFDGIVACGIFHRGLTSISALLRRPVTVAEAAERFIPAFCSVFQNEPEERTLAEYMHTIGIIEDFA